MKNILLASAAAAALLLMPLTASAQYATEPATVTAPAASTSDSTPSVTTTTTQTMPAMTSEMGPATASTTTTTTTTDQSMATTETLTPAQSEAQQNAQMAAPSYDTATAAPAYASASNSAVRGELISDAKALELAQDAGMEAVPTSAAAVCQPRSVELTGGATHANRNALEFAVDRASVCELQAVEIPARGAAGFRQTLIAQGVDESKISVSDDGANDVEMTFAGVATSGGMYASLYNPVQTASNDMSYAPTSSQAAPDAPVTDDDMDMSAPAPTETAPTL